MKRRDAIKMLSIGMGYTISATSLATIVSSCKTEPTITWTPTFFSKAQVHALDEILEAMLPATETPGAKDVELTALIDRIVSDCYKKEDQEKFRTRMNAFLGQIGDEAALKNTTAAQATKILEDHISKPSESERAKINELLANDVPAAKEDQDLYYRHKFLKDLRYLAISGYFSSEIVATKHLNYLPVPGPYQGCIPASEVGTTWAL